MTTAPDPCPSANPLEFRFHGDPMQLAFAARAEYSGRIHRVSQTRDGRTEPIRRSTSRAAFLAS